MQSGGMILPAVIAIAIVATGVFAVVSSPRKMLPPSFPTVQMTRSETGAVDAYVQVDRNLWFIKHGSLFTPAELTTMNAAFQNCRTKFEQGLAEFANAQMWLIAECVRDTLAPLSVDYYQGASP